MRVAGDACALSIVLSQMACSAAIRKHLQTPLLLRVVVCITMLRCVEALGVHIVIRNLSTLHQPIGGWLQHGVRGAAARRRLVSRLWPKRKLRPNRACRAV